MHLLLRYWQSVFRWWGPHTISNLRGPASVGPHIRQLLCQRWQLPFPHWSWPRSSGQRGLGEPGERVRRVGDIWRPSLVWLRRPRGQAWGDVARRAWRGGRDTQRGTSWGVRWGLGTPCKPRAPRFVRMLVDIWLRFSSFYRQFGRRRGKIWKGAADRARTLEVTFRLWETSLLLGWRWRLWWWLRYWGGFRLSLYLSGAGCNQDEKNISVL